MDERCQGAPWPALVGGDLTLVDRWDVRPRPTGPGECCVRPRDQLPPLDKRELRGWIPSSRERLERWPGPPCSAGGRAIVSYGGKRPRSGRKAGWPEWHHLAPRALDFRSSGEPGRLGNTEGSGRGQAALHKIPPLQAAGQGAIRSCPHRQRPATAHPLRGRAQPLRSERPSPARNSERGRVARASPFPGTTPQHPGEGLSGSTGPAPAQGLPRSLPARSEVTITSTRSSRTHFHPQLSGSAEDDPGT